MQRILIAACLCCLFTVPALAQRVVIGKITDDNNEPLTGVSIIVKEKRSLGTLSDLNGRYTLELPDDGKEYTIEVSCIGYESQSHKFNPTRRKGIDFILHESAVDLGIVVVTGTRTPKRLKDSPIITKVITENELKKIDVGNIGELLQTELPGIEFSYSMNQQLSMNMQGFGGQSVLFLVDGERVAGETLDNIDYNRLNLANVERIEIIKGAASSLYGSNAVGGVVNIISKMPTDPWTLNLNTRFARYNQQRHGGTASFHTGKFTNLTNVQYTSSDSIYLGDKTVSTYRRVHANRSWNVKDRMQYIFTDQFKVTGHAGFFFRERDSDTSEPQTFRDRYRGYNAGLKGEYIFNDMNNMELSYVFDQYDKSEYAISSSTDVQKYSNVQHNLRALYNHSFSEKNVLTLGGDFMRDYLMSYQFKDNGNKHQYTADLFAQMDWTPFDKFNVVGGLRYDYFSDNDINRVSPKISLMYKPGRFTIRGSYAAGFRAPTLKEKYMEFNMAGMMMIYGNPNLKSESSNNFSLSGEYSKSYYNFSVTGYYNRIKDRITTSWDETLKGTVYNNIHMLSVVGADANASARFPCGISANLSYTYTHESVSKGKLLVGESRPHTATARIEYGKSWNNYGFNVSLNGRVLSKVDTYEFEDTTTGAVKPVTYPAYTIWKLTLQQDIHKGVSLIMGVDNLFGYVPSYYYNNSPYTKGAEFSAGLSIDIDKFFR